MEMMAEAKENVKAIVRDKLERCFAADFVFDPIIVVLRVDDYHEEDFRYLDIHVVFDGDQAILDPHWTGTLIGRVQPDLKAAGIDAFPVFSFVSKSDWMNATARQRRLISGE